MGLRRRWAGAVLLCACRAAAEEQGLRRAGKERVLGVGLGVFLLSFFFIAMCALCWAGALLPQERGEQWIFNVVGTLGFGVVACVLFLADERPEYASEERAEREHDDNLIGLIVVAGLLACAAAHPSRPHSCRSGRPATGRASSTPRASASLRGRPSRRKARGSGLGPELGPDAGVPGSSPDSRVAAVGKMIIVNEFSTVNPKLRLGRILTEQGRETRKRSRKVPTLMFESS